MKIVIGFAAGGIEKSLHVNVAVLLLHPVGVWSSGDIEFGHLVHGRQRSNQCANVAVVHRGRCGGKRQLCLPARRARKIVRARAGAARGRAFSAALNFAFALGLGRGLGEGHHGGGRNCFWGWHFLSGERGAKGCRRRVIFITVHLCGLQDAIGGTAFTGLDRDFVVVNGIQRWHSGFHPTERRRGFGVGELQSESPGFLVDIGHIESPVGLDEFRLENHFAES